MPLGPRDTTSLVQLTGVDAALLAGFQLQDGATYAQIVGEMSTAIGALNAEFTSDPFWSGLVSYSDQIEFDYRSGSSNGFEAHTEYGRADAKRADLTGHMLPLRAYDRMLGWTWDYLRKARLNQVQADVFDAIKDARDLIRKALLTRLLKRIDESGVGVGLSATGLSPGFATTAASTGVDFVPPAFGGTSFANTHEHYIGITGGAFTAPVFADAYDELREHGHEAPFDFVVGPDSVAAIKLLTGYVAAADPLIQYGTANNVAAIGQGYFGTISNFRLREVRGIPAYYGAGYKTYGPNSQRNPLRVRLQKGESSLRVVAMPDPNAGGALNPIQNLMLFSEFGVGVGDRTAATPRYTNSATWADGTPT